MADIGCSFHRSNDSYHSPRRVGSNSEALSNGCVLEFLLILSASQPCFGPTLAKSYPIDGRGRLDLPAVTSPDRG